MMQRFLRACGHIACTRYRSVLYVSVLLTVLAIVPVFRTKARFTASINNLMPENNASAEAFNRALNDFGAADEAYIVLRVMDPGEVGSVEPWAIELAGRLRALPEIRDAYCRFVRPDERGFLESEIKRHGLLFLPPAGIDEVKEALQDRNLKRSLKKMRNELASPAADSRETQRLICKNALNLLPVFQKHMGATYQNFDGSGASNLMTDVGPHDAMILLVVQPIGPAQRLEYATRVMQLLRDETYRICGEGMDAEWASDAIWWQPWTWNDGHKPFPGEMPPALRRLVKPEFGGGYQAAVAYTDHIQSSLLATLIGSLIGVLALFGFFYRRYGVLLYVGLPLVMIVCWTLGLGHLIFGKINMISSSFAAVLIGLGVDYGIHIYNRYAEERARGQGVEASWITSLEHTGGGVVVGMLTTAASFFALYVTRFRGLSQFGALAGLGLALSLPAMVFLLPALVVWRSKKGLGERSRALGSATFSLPRLAAVIERHSRPIAWTGIALAVFAALWIVFSSQPVRFDARLASLRPQEDSVFVLGREIGERFTKKNPARQMLIVTGKDEAAAMNRASSILPALGELEAEGQIAEYEVMTQRLPSPDGQILLREHLRQIDFARAEEVMREYLTEEGLYLDDFSDSFEFLQSHAALAQSTEPLLPSQYRKTPLWRVLNRLIARQKTTYSLEQEAPEALAAGAELILAAEPTSRDSALYFVPGARVTTAALSYLATRGVEACTVARSRDGLATTGGLSEAPATERLSLDTMRAALASGEPFYFAEMVRLDGEPLLGPDTPVTAALLDFLQASDCREIRCYSAGWSVRAFVTPPPSQTQALELSESWIGSLRSRLDPGGTGQVVLTGTMVVAHDLANIVKEDFAYISVAVSVIAVLVLALCYREPKRVFFSVLPIALGLLYLVGIMSIGSIYFNFINVLVVPVIIGLGVDNGIHLVHRYYESSGSIRPMVVDTGRAIVITNLTSMVGFGSLCLGSYKGLRSMGMLSVLGLSASLVAALVVLPAILLLWGRGSKISAAVNKTSPGGAIQNTDAATPAASQGAGSNA